MASEKLPPVFCAIDTQDLETAHNLVTQLQIPGIGIKLGLEFFCAQGATGVKSIQASIPGASIFLDLKFHDIPNTVAGAIRAVVPLRPALINVHAGGGPEMMSAAASAAREAAEKLGIPRPRVLAVTVLTSLDQSDLQAVGQTCPVEDQVVRLAKLAQQCGMDGVVCSAKEIKLIRTACGPDFALVVPGIRPVGDSQSDQKRVMAPGEAMAAGATSLVVGRPITASEKPQLAAAAIVEEAQAHSVSTA
mmetsp:Transcript_52145/g.86486  ORF Transcript_52145/g.86486 Transcript_52145/m.86486 type:complete len:248 (+) Transcript_52145:18-761(+)|eukprot:CAMPEP_0119321918 /NCGR_PEP_ID=MMETSP1333-20130426/56798_1 /TAXON_ID=418940 /ORGANISM="Scyphosphaera apsteinii, Strain RCC1455" /LENGTH=247 /DNA_ID=CAMNT_0007329011 /DNA_START=16 /DNA_END=759 /DNA_ORIENTATION=-